MFAFEDEAGVGFAAWGEDAGDGLDEPFFTDGAGVWVIWGVAVEGEPLVDAWGLVPLEGVEVVADGVEWVVMCGGDGCGVGCGGVDHDVMVLEPVGEHGVVVVLPGVAGGAPREVAGDGDGLVEFVELDGVGKFGGLFDGDDGVGEAGEGVAGESFGRLFFGGGGSEEVILPVGVADGGGWVCGGWVWSGGGGCGDEVDGVGGEFAGGVFADGVGDLFDVFDGAGFGAAVAVDDGEGGEDFGKFEAAFPHGPGDGDECGVLFAFGDFGGDDGGGGGVLFFAEEGDEPFGGGLDGLVVPFFDAVPFVAAFGVGVDGGVSDDISACAAGVDAVGDESLGVTDGEGIGDGEEVVFAFGAGDGGEGVGEFAVLEFEGFEGVVAAGLGIHVEHPEADACGEADVGAGVFGPPLGDDVGVGGGVVGAVFGDGLFAVDGHDGPAALGVGESGCEDWIRGGGGCGGGHANKLLLVGMGVDLVGFGGCGMDC